MEGVSLSRFPRSLETWPAEVAASHPLAGSLNTESWLWTESPSHLLHRWVCRGEPRQRRRLGSPETCCMPAARPLLTHRAIYLSLLSVYNWALSGFFHQCRPLLCDIPELRLYCDPSPALQHSTTPPVPALVTSVIKEVSIQPNPGSATKNRRSPEIGIDLLSYLRW